MLEISLYQIFYASLCKDINHIAIAKIKVIQLTYQQRLQLEEGFRQDKSHAYRIRCHVAHLKSTGLTSEHIGEQTKMTHISVNSRRNASRQKASIAWRPSWGSQ